MGNNIETISYINPGDGLDHPIDAVTVGGLTLTSAEKELWNNKQDALSFDSIPTENSNNLVKSGPLYSVITENELVTATALNDLNDRVTSLEDFSETDPTVPAWAKAANKPTYTADEVDALSSDATLDDIADGDTRKLSDYIPKSGATLTPHAQLIITDSGPDMFCTITDNIVQVNHADGGGASAITSDGVFVTNDGDYDNAQNYTIYHDDSIVRTVGNSSNTINLPSASGTIALTSDIPTAVTESTVAGWGFTKNSGTLTSESDPVFMSSPAASITAANISAWNAKQNALVFDSIPTENSDNLVKSGVLYSVITNNELVVSTALNDLNDRVSDLENNTGSGGITSVMFNGVSASISDGVASISASIPAEVTEATVAGWGFTKNTGTLASESDPVFAASVAASITTADISNWNSKTSNTGTITGISMNGSSMGTSGNVNLGTVVTGLSMNGSAVTVSNGVANLGTVLTSHQSIKTINGQTITGTGDVTISGLPTTTSSDNGKILQVVNGSWTLTTPVSIYSGNGSPDNTQGTNGDLYIQTS